MEQKEGPDTNVQIVEVEYNLQLESSGLGGGSETESWDDDDDETDPVGIIPVSLQHRTNVNHHHHHHHHHRDRWVCCVCYTAGQSWLRIFNDITTYAFLYKLLIGEISDIVFNILNVWINYLSMDADLRWPYIIFCILNYIQYLTAVVAFFMFNRPKSCDFHWWPLGDTDVEQHYGTVAPRILFLGGILSDIPFFVLNGLFIKRMALRSLSPGLWLRQHPLAWVAISWSSFMLWILLRDVYSFLTQTIFILPASAGYDGLTQRFQRRCGRKTSQLVLICLVLVLLLALYLVP